MTVRTAEEFYDAALECAERLADRVHLIVPFEPDTNLVCLALNPVGNESLAAMNRFGRELFAHMRVDSDQPLQIKQFIGSYTSLQAGSVPQQHAARILAELGVDEGALVGFPDDGGVQADHIFILRHTLMNPWLLERPGGTQLHRAVLGVSGIGHRPGPGGSGIVGRRG